MWSNQRTLSNETGANCLWHLILHGVTRLSMSWNLAPAALTDAVHCVEVGAVVASVTRHGDWRVCR